MNQYIYQPRITVEIDEKLKQEVKVRAAQEKTTITEIIIKLIKRWLKKKVVLLVLFSLISVSCAFSSEDKIEKAKNEIEEMNLQGVSVKVIEPSTFTEAQKDKIKEAIEQLKKGR